jgi:hypothetical protein
MKGGGVPGRGRHRPFKKPAGVAGPAFIVKFRRASPGAVRGKAE